MRARDSITLTLCLLVLGFFAILAIRHVMLDLPREMLDDVKATLHSEADAMAARIRSALNVRPEITSAGQVLVRGDRAVTQLVTVERDLTAEHTWSHTWLGSSKVLRLKGTFVARAGIPLAGRIRIEIDQKSGATHVTVPDAEVFSVDLKDVRILEDADGFWNKITAAEREEAIRELQARARKAAEASDLIPVAKENAVAQINALIRSSATPRPLIREEIPR